MYAELNFSVSFDEKDCDLIWAQLNSAFELK